MAVNLFRILEICSLVMVCVSLVRCLLTTSEIRLFRRQYQYYYYSALESARGPPLTTVAFYYEAREKESERFIDEQLIPTYEKLNNVTKLWIIPYGNIDMSQNSAGVLEGLPECESCNINMQHACVVDTVPDNYLKLKIIKCLMKFSRINAANETLEKCSQEFQLPIFDKIRDCLSGIKGMELLKANGLTTHAAKDVYDGPFITINDSEAAAVGTVDDLLSLICKLRGNNEELKAFCEIH